MSQEFQLEMNLFKLPDEEFKNYLIQKQIDELSDSMGKVRRKLFAEMGDLKKICAQLQTQNEELTSTLKRMQGDKDEWIYKKEGYLFELKSKKIAI